MTDKAMRRLSRRFLPEASFFGTRLMGELPNAGTDWSVVELPMGNIMATDPLRKLIRHSSSLQYYAGEGQWTSELEHAKEFESIFSMAQEAQKYHMRGYCCFVLKSGEQEVQFRLSAG